MAGGPNYGVDAVYRDHFGGFRGTQLGALATAAAVTANEVKNYFVRGYRGLVQLARGPKHRIYSAYRAIQRQPRVLISNKAQYNNYNRKSRSSMPRYYRRRTYPGRFRSKSKRTFRKFSRSRYPRRRFFKKYYRSYRTSESRVDKWWDTHTDNFVVPKSNTLGTGNALPCENEGSTTNRFCLNAPGLGTGGEGRLRDRITNKHMLFKYSLQITGYELNNNTWEYVDPTVHIFVVLDTQNNGSTLIDAGEVYENDSGLLFPERLLLQRNMQNTDRYKVLRVEKVVLNAQKMVHYNAGVYITSVRSMLVGEFSVNLKNISTQFTTGASTPSSADIRDNAIKVIVVSNQDAFDQRDVDISFHCRLRFQDL